ncbi:MAG TPA: ABC transporter ATP-binding protein [Stellaceae bacterium]|nr:ABC transporter ATP-binding protein [Stellaceae bacterium]
MTAAALELDRVSSGYGEALVIREVALSLAPGEIFALLGKNGMGKSTLLKTVMGYLPLAAGAVRLFGEAVAGLPPYRLARRGVAYSPQEQALFQDLSVGDNLRLGLADSALFAAGLERVGAFFPFLPERLRQRAGTLSGGEQKMLLVARALMARPRLLLIDEISEGLQPSIVQKLAEVLRAERAASQAAILLVEQNVHFARAVADRYAVLKRGEIVDSGRLDDAGAESRIVRELSV